MLLTRIIKCHNNNNNNNKFPNTEQANVQRHYITLHNHTVQPPRAAIQERSTLYLYTIKSRYYCLNSL